ncbi:hypothetical protein HYH02_014473 [Chlamydomonas schloesseri]|uniref:Kinesin motor domain-containing protein n=1 Tax=Chlamydomonas schloesseri TaxID=2026947 RepID=A0A835VSX4_9CHLO|nr:hypothetical protein HYH02_014473 [Chlamydomonas schloesseri]|eukprot:KAG2428082.1 hypothetical protein HYH02_014473 [Chlamydomonas schloesseri]
MFVPQVTIASPAASRGSPLTPLDGGMRSEGSFSAGSAGSMNGPAGGAMRGRTASANSRPSPLAATTRATTAAAPGGMGGLGMTTTVVATNLSEADNIKVAVRVRPLFPHETDKGGTSVVQVTSNTAVKVVVPGPAGTSMQKDFAFHACLGPEVSQSDVLHLCGVPQLLDAALSGYNVTVFAYGQTGSGKTYTMSGREEVIAGEGYTGDQTHDGIMSRAIGHLYQQIDAKKADMRFSLSASYLEIYNEGIYDLLNLKNKNLPVKWDAALGFFVPGLKQATCNKLDTMMDVIRTGMKHRHVGSHELNIESSRSHSIMTIYLTSTPADPSAADFGTPRMGKISFVDLAGSERLKDSKSEGVMLKETTNINKSLFVLGKVISALAERDSSGTSSAHIPYRDSKLTKLLMDSLGGNALALMIACCSPASTAVEETLSTLSYATRAKNIQNRPTVQYDPKEAQIANLRREIDLLRQENAYLREQVRMGGGVPGMDPQTPLYTHRPPPPGTAAAADSSGGSGGGAPPGSAPHHNHQHGSAIWPSLLGGGGAGGDAAASAPASAGGGGAAAAGALGSSMSAPPHLPPARLMSPRLGGAPDALRNSINLGSGHSIGNMAHLLEPLRVSVDAAAGAGSPGGGGGLAAAMAARRLSTNGPAGQLQLQQQEEDIDLMRRLMETQSLLSRFSEENGRLAKENDRLRANRQLLSQEHGEVLDEIETLRAKLGQLESAVLSGNQTATAAARAALASAMGGGGGGGQQRGDSPAGAGAGRGLYPMNSGLSVSAGGAPPATAYGGGAAGGGLRSVPSGHLASPLPGAMHDYGGAGGGGGMVIVPPPGSAGGGGGQFGMMQPQQQQQQFGPPPGSSGGMMMVMGPGMGPMGPLGGGGMMGMGMMVPGGGMPHSPHTPLMPQQPHHSPQQHLQQYQQQQMQMQYQQQQQQQPRPPPQSSGGPPATAGSAAGGSGSGNPLSGIANVMAVGAAPGGSNANAMRTRSRYGGGSSGGPGGSADEIIVADRNKLALLLATAGPAEPAVQVRPVPIKPPEQVYANPAKNYHAQHIQKQIQIQRSGSNPSSPKAPTPGGSSSAMSPGGGGGSQFF